jgi:malonyl-CoA/methylmalonyl-CoA synthetase
MHRYLHEPEVTAASFRDDGFFKTGDIARREGSYYFIMGRASVDSESFNPNMKKSSR